MRQEHRAGEKSFVDFSGDGLRVVDAVTGEVREAKLFVAVLGASNLTYVEPVFSEDMATWVGCHVRAFAYFGGVIPTLPLSATRRHIARARAAAARHGRSLRIWRHVTVVTAPTDEEAEARARRIRHEAVRLASGPLAEHWLGAVQLDRDRERGRATAADGARQLSAYVDRSLAGAYVGSPATVAARMGLLRAAGVGVIQLDMPTETEQDRHLRRDLVARLRAAYLPPAPRGSAHAWRGW